METKENVTAEELQDIEAKELVDLSEFEGVKRKIISIEVVDVNSHYINGKFSPNETISTKVLRVSTEKIEKDGTQYNASELFNLQRNKENNNWGVSLSEKSKLRKLMNKLKVTKVGELIGKEVILRIKQSGFLGFFN